MLSSPFQLGVLQEDELPDLCRFVVNAFGAEAISLSSDMTSFEKALMNPAAELLNGYSSLVAFAEGKQQQQQQQYYMHATNLSGVNNS